MIIVILLLINRNPYLYASFAVAADESPMVDRDLGRIDQLIFLIVKPLSCDLLADLEILGDRHSLLFGLKNSIGPLGDLNSFKTEFVHKFNSGHVLVVHIIKNEFFYSP